jgi:hypothetical protein
MKKIYVIKKSGERELYNEFKVIDSMRKSGANEKSINEVMNKLRKEMHNNIQTKEIFRFVFRELRKKERGSGIKYNLKQGIIEMSLGGGYVFEKFMARVLKEEGYSVKLNEIIKGKFIEHEIDIQALKNSEKMMVECKHSANPWGGTSVQTALYIYARFLDLNQTFNSVMLATNTRFSQQVIDYSKGVGLKLIGWKYPEGGSLEEKIEKYKLYPVTILPLKKSKINTILQKNILTVTDLLKENNLEPLIKKEINELLNTR